MNHAISPSNKGKDNEMEADLIGATLAKKIGYDRASFFKFLFNAKAEELRNGSPNDPHLEPSDRVNFLKQNADFELSHNTIQYIDSLAQQLKQGVAEEKQRLDPKCWTGYKKQGTKMKGDTRVNNCVPVKESSILTGLKKV
jgi:hypothetical protein